MELNGKVNENIITYQQATQYYHFHALSLLADLTTCPLNIVIHITYNCYVYASVIRVNIMIIFSQQPLHHQPLRQQQGLPPPRPRQQRMDQSPQRRHQ